MAELERRTRKNFGDPNNPLLVSVRSGARVSMPGMMDTILNLGLNDFTVVGLAELTGNDRFAWDAYRRFIMMFSCVVLGVEKEVFEERIDEAQAAFGRSDRSGNRRARVARSRRGLQSDRFRTHGPGVSAGSSRAVGSRNPRGVRLLEFQTCHRLPALQQNSRRLGHGGKRGLDGVRQYGRRLGNGSRVHARPEHR